MNLFIEEVNTMDLVKAYGTPLYVLSESKIRQQCQSIRQGFLDKYENTKAVYASKAFLPSAMCKIIESEGLGLDVVSGGELYTAIHNHFPMDRVEFNGNNKTYEELTMAIENNIGRIIVDNAHELEMIQAISEAHDKRTDILFRIVPDTETATHDYISTGHKRSKFGLSLENNYFFEVLEKAIQMDHVNFKGIHFHIGSQLMTPDSHINAIHKAMHLILDIQTKYDHVIEELNIGGGFGIQYLPKDQPMAIHDFLSSCMETIEAYCQEHNLIRPKIIIEPGRWIIGEAGITLYTVGSIKTNGGEKYAAVDGGMTDNIRPGLYQASYHAVLANKMTHRETEPVTISGKFCESSDILIKNIQLPRIQSGDILAVYSTGAYTYAMASNYNKQPIPGVVLVHKDRHRPIVRRQTYADLLQYDIVPEELL